MKSFDFVLGMMFGAILAIAGHIGLGFLVHPEPGWTHKCPLTGETGHLVKIESPLATYETSHSRFSVGMGSGRIIMAEQVFPTPGPCEAASRKLLEDAKRPPTEAEMNGVVPKKLRPRTGDLPGGT